MEHLAYAALEGGFPLESARGRRHPDGVRGTRFGRRAVLCARVGWALFAAGVLLKYVTGGSPLLVFELDAANWLVATALAVHVIAIIAKRRTREFDWIRFVDDIGQVTPRAVESALKALATARGNRCQRPRVRASRRRGAGARFSLAEA